MKTVTLNIHFSWHIQCISLMSDSGCYSYGSVVSMLICFSGICEVNILLTKIHVFSKQSVILYSLTTCTVVNLCVFVYVCVRFSMLDLAGFKNWNRL